MTNLKRWAVAPLIVALVGMGGCTYITRPLSGGGELTVVSSGADRDTRVTLDATTSVYAARDAQTIHVLLVSGPVDTPTRVMHIQMFWQPRAAKTPLDPSATNATVRLVEFQDDQVGVYGGGGHLWPRTTAGKAQWSARLRNATLRPMHRSRGFVDDLGNAVAEGAVNAHRDEQRTLELLTRYEQMIEDRLGYPMMLGAAR